MIWKKSTYSGTATECVELAWDGAVRDSKNVAGPILAVDIASLVESVKTGVISR